MAQEKGFIQQRSNDHYVPGSVLGVGDTYVLFEPPIRFTVQQLIPHTYAADVNFQGKVLKMKIMSTFQNYLKYLYWLYPKKNFKCCPIFNEKFIVRGKSLYKQLWGGVGRAETGSGVFQRSLAGGHSLLIYKVAI